MRLVYLYGPPGVGKLTVARELVALTGLKLLHNHLTVNLVKMKLPSRLPSRPGAGAELPDVGKLGTPGAAPATGGGRRRDGP